MIVLSLVGGALCLVGFGLQVLDAGGIRAASKPLVFSVITVGVCAVNIRWARRNLRALERQRPKKEKLCPTCGYNLRGNVSGVCSECGTRFRRARYPLVKADET
ncbi:MAG: hypothetical protein JSV19_14090 [Phycisphaerales bacterium]|nr:MAG: hypothetical protein JSV19_14090 [Phycisphaerales bacterium]